MRRPWRRSIVVGAVAAGLIASASPAAAIPGDQLWAKRYNGPYLDDYGMALAVSPDGSKVFVTGYSFGGLTWEGYQFEDYATTAYGSDGHGLWTKRYDGPGSSIDYGLAIAVSSDGRRVFVTGSSYGKGTFADYATLAYRADGSKLWTQRFDGPSSGSDGASAIVVSPDGSMVFVTGSSTGKDTGTDYLTIAYSASTGAKVWSRRYDGPTSGADAASAIAVSPDGGEVFVTGSSEGQGTDFATVAYDVDGSLLWDKRYDGPATGRASADGARGIVVSPDGKRVFVAGPSTGSGTYEDYATIAYASIGAELWAKRFEGKFTDVATSIAVSPDGAEVIVGGSSLRSNDDDYFTVAYKPGGGKLWAARYDGTASAADQVRDVTVGPDGRVFVTGESEGTGTGADYATVAYGADGAELWATRYDRASQTDGARSIGVSPDGATVFVVGRSREGDYDYATIAYAAV